MDGRGESRMVRIKPAKHANLPRFTLLSMQIHHELTIPQHESKDCPERQIPPEGYVCRRCNQGGHYIRDCPTKYEKGDTGGKKPPPGYVCRGCASELHLIDDCPVVQQSRQEREERKRRDGPPKDIGRMYTGIADERRANTLISADECWFCLSNPKLAYAHHTFRTLDLILTFSIENTF